MKSEFYRFRNFQKITFTESELKEIEEIKKRYARELWDEFDCYMENCDLDTSTHVTSGAKIQALETLKNDIINDRLFNKHFFDVLTLKGAEVLFNDNKFTEFVISYAVLDHDKEQIARIILEDIWKVHVLNLMISDWEKSNIQLQTNNHHPIFLDDKSERFVKYCLARSKHKNKMVFLAAIFQFMTIEETNVKYNFAPNIKKYQFSEYLDLHGYKTALKNLKTKIPSYWLIRFDLCQ